MLAGYYTTSALVRRILKKNDRAGRRLRG